MSTRQKLLWVAALYFAEGFPFGIVVKVIPTYLRLQEISLADIGFLSLARLPWTLKLLWAPAVDLWGSRRTWIWVSQALIGVSLLGFAALHPANLLWMVGALLIVLAIFAATQDIAIDAYTIQLMEKRELGPANGVRVTAYRLALIGSGGILIAAADFFGWTVAFICAALVLAGISVVSSRAPTLVSTGAQEGIIPPPSLREAILTPLRLFLQRPGFWGVAVFVLTFKLGDMAIGPMIEPFWVDRHFSLSEIALIPGTFGVVATIAGALLGGVLTTRWGIFRALWMLGVLQAASNLVYAGAAALPPSHVWMYTASLVESFCGGLGTAPFLAFLMSICDKRHAATQYALLSSLFGLTGALSGAFSGVATELFGYAAYFTATFFLAWPAFFLLPWVKGWAEDEQESQGS